MQVLVWHFRCSRLSVCRYFFGEYLCQVPYFIMMCCIIIQFSSSVHFPPATVSSFSMRNCAPRFLSPSNWSSIRFLLLCFFSFSIGFALAPCGLLHPIHLQFVLHDLSLWRQGQRLAYWLPVTEFELFISHKQRSLSNKFELQFGLLLSSKSSFTTTAS